MFPFLWGVSPQSKLCCLNGACKRNSPIFPILSCFLSLPCLSHPFLLQVSLILLFNLPHSLYPFMSNWWGGRRDLWKWEEVEIKRNRIRVGWKPRNKQKTVVARQQTRERKESNVKKKQWWEQHKGHTAGRDSKCRKKQLATATVCLPNTEEVDQWDC